MRMNGHGTNFLERIWVQLAASADRAVMQAVSYTHLTLPTKA